MNVVLDVLHVLHAQSQLHGHYLMISLLKLTQDPSLMDHMC